MFGHGVNAQEPVYYLDAEMKQVLTCLCLATVFPCAALAQSSGSLPPSNTSKKPSVSAPKAAEPAKPKQRLMTLDQLRRCMKLANENATEAVALTKERVDVETERAKLMEEKGALQTRSETLQAEGKAIVEEQAELLEGSKELAKLAEKSDLKEAEAKRLSHNVRIDSNRQRVDDFNASRIAIKTTKDALDPRIEASNVRLKKFQNSVEEHNYGVEDWKAECANRPYAEADEVIIKKEMGN